jgi:hypothetical protein
VLKEQGSKEAGRKETRILLEEDGSKDITPKE